MKTFASVAPPLHLFVCAHVRDANDPLGAGCGARGEAVYSRLKDEVAARRAFNSVWVTKTHCLGICPKSGCTVAEYPRGILYRDVETADASGLLATPAAAGANGVPAPQARGAQLDEEDRGSEAVDQARAASFSFGYIDDALAAMEKLQADKVIALARRLKPGLTAEDIRNPHDFPELDDSDWHYEDGMLTGIQGVRTALRARANERGDS
jgi:(2Fe-2S) ferredoxin